MPKPSPIVAGNRTQPEKTKSSWFLDLVLVVSFLGLVLILLGATVWGFFRPATISSKLAAVSMTTKPEGSKLQIWLAPPLAEWPMEHPVLLTSQLVNTGDKPVRVTVSLSTGTECTPAVRQVQDSGDIALQPIDVPAYSYKELKLTADFASCSQEQRRRGIPLRVHYAWNEETLLLGTEGPKKTKTPQSQSRAIEQIASTSPVVIESPGVSSQGRWGRAFTDGYAVLKDLGWPFLLLLIGYVLQEISKHREVQQTLRVQEQERQQSRRADRQQILTHLLPEYMSLVQTHYLPIARRMQTVAGAWKELEAAADAPAKDAAYRKLLAAILLMRRRWLHLFLLKGGVFFRTSTGEEIFADGISRFVVQCHQSFGDTVFESAALALAPDATVPDAMRKYFPATGAPSLVTSPVPMPPGPGAQVPETPLPDMNGMLQKLKVWVDANAGPGDGFGGYVNLLTLCEKVLSFECDRIFYQTDPDQKTDGDSCNDSSGWYFDPPQLEIRPEMCMVPSADPTADDTNADAEAYSRSKLFALITEYLKRVPSECQPKGFQLPENWLREEQRKAAAAAAQAGGAGAPPGPTGSAGP